MENDLGYFVSVDGIDGCGKSTQAEMLAQWVESQGFIVQRVRDPGGTALGESLREILLHRKDLELSMRAEMLLYMASRAQMVDEIIRPALARNEVVICDRYLLANVVYQGSAGGLLEEDIWNVGRVATAACTPDLTLLFDVEVSVAMQRVGAEKDRLESRGASYMEKVRQGYLQQLSSLPNGIRLDSSGAVDAIHEQVLLAASDSFSEYASRVSR